MNTELAPERRRQPTEGLRPLRFQRPMYPSALEIENYFQQSRDEAWYSNGGPCLEEFSRRLGARVGAAALPLANATLALMLGVAALCRRVSSSDSGARRVLIPSFTFPAVVEAVLWNGLEPVFVDVSPDHLHLDPALLADALVEKASSTCLVIAGSSFGTPPPPEVRRAWEHSCAAAGVPLLIDSAAGCGAVAADGVAIGAQGDAEIVSFHITKPFGIGEGGAVFSRDPHVIEHVRRLANFGFGTGRQVQELHGSNAKLDEIHAAIGLAVLDEIDARIASRRRAAAAVVRSLGPGFVPQLGHELGTYQFVSVLAPSACERDRILRDAEGVVQMRTYYEPLHLHPAFVSIGAHRTLEVTEDISRRILSLPMFDDMTEAECRLICDVVRGR